MPEENECRPVIQRAGVAGDLPTSLQQRLDCDVLFRRGVNAGWDGEGRDSREKSTPVKNEFPHFRRVSGSPPSVEKRPRGWEFLKAAPKFHRLRRIGGAGRRACA